MADRVTRAQIKQLFTVFCNTGGFKMSSRYDDPGLYLDYYMGYQIVEAKAGSGGQHEPFGGRRYSPKEFRIVLNFAIAVMSAKRYGYTPMADRDPSDKFPPNPRRMARRLRRR